MYQEQRKKDRETDERQRKKEREEDESQRKKALKHAEATKKAEKEADDQRRAQKILQKHKDKVLEKLVCGICETEIDTYYNVFLL